MDLEIQGKYALVTGGTHGIGKSIALNLAKEGCNVAVCSRDYVKIEKTVKEIKRYGVQAKGYKTDVMIRQDIKKTVDDIIKEWGTLHILVNNVGGGGRWGTDDVEKNSEQIWNDVYTKNVLSAIRFTIPFISYMKKQKWGRIISISSKFGKEGGGRSWFNMAKSAQISMMKTLSMDKNLVRYGITFNSVAPGGIMIPDTGWEKCKKNNPILFEEYISQLPMGRMGYPNEVAHVVVFLCSELAKFVNGACVSIDGGETSSF